MARIPPRWRTLDRAEGPWRPPPIGHNQGPPLESRNGWASHCWRQAHKKAWRAPPIEVVRRRAARAAELGLSYRDYTAILLDRGAQPKALIFDLGTLIASRHDRITTDSQGRIQPLPGVVERLTRLRNCRVFVVANQANAEAARSVVEQLNALCGGVIADHRVGKLRSDLLLELLAAHGLTAGVAVMVGAGERGRLCAEAARLARFLLARDYFGHGG
ncbi:MAG: hypothetical protein ACFCUQ_14470 [Kiloniellales bacterium]